MVALAEASRAGCALVGLAEEVMWVGAEPGRGRRAAGAVEGERRDVGAAGAAAGAAAATATATAAGGAAAAVADACTGESGGERPDEALMEDSSERSGSGSRRVTEAAAVMGEPDVVRAEPRTGESDLFSDGASGSASMAAARRGNGEKEKRREKRKEKEKKKKRERKKKNGKKSVNGNSKSPRVKGKMR